MAAILDSGTCFFVKDKISAVSKDGEKDLIVFLPSTPTGFRLTMPSTEIRDEAYDKFKDSILQDI